MTPRTLLQMVRDNAGNGAELCFVGVGADGSLIEEKRSYEALLANGERLAGALRSAGLGSGDRSALLTRNRAAFVDAMVASEIAGTEFVAIDPRIGGDKLISMLRFANCRGVIACEDGMASLVPVRAGLPEIEWIWTIDELDALMRAAAPLSGSPAPFDRTMQLLYTSSTTGDAKAIVVTHGRFGAVGSYAEIFGMTRSDRL